MHEIIHLSLSRSSNHLSTHFFNGQETYFFNYDNNKANPSSIIDSSVNFRSGISSDGRTETFTPRCLLWDLKGGMGSLPKHNILYGEINENEIESSNAWNNRIDVISEDKIEENAYQNALNNDKDTSGTLDTSNTCFWTDYNHLYYHPRSFLELKDWEFDPKKYPMGKQKGYKSETNTDNLDNNAFYGFDVGSNAWDALNEDNIDYLDNAFRPLLEECDFLQGVNILTEIDTAWGGFTSRLLSSLRDDFLPKNSIPLWGIESPYINVHANSNNSSNSMFQKINRIKSLVNLTEFASIYFPLTETSNNFDYSSVLGSNGVRQFSSKSKWHTMALSYAAFESFTLPTRLNSNLEQRSSVGDLINNLTQGSQRNISSSFNIGFGKDLLSMGWKQDDKKNIYSNNNKNILKDKNHNKSMHTFSKVSLVRGSETDDNLLLEKYENIHTNKQELIDNRTNIIRMLQGFNYKLGLPNPETFPDIIEKQKNDLISVYVSSATSQLVNKIFRDMDIYLMRCNLISADEKSNLREAVSSIASEYEFGYDDSDSDDNMID